MPPKSMWVVMWVIVVRLVHPREYTSVCHRIQLYAVICMRIYALYT